jgi:hypothetical protein
VDARDRAAIVNSGTRVRRIRTNLRHMVMIGAQQALQRVRARIQRAGVARAATGGKRYSPRAITNEFISTRIASLFRQ